MQKKKYNHLDFYERCMKTGQLPGLEGLCYESEGKNPNIDPEILELFAPNDKQKKKLIREGKCPVMWGSGLKDLALGEVGGFTPMRQTIVLFMAAINKEL